MNERRLYTVEEATILGQREICAREGHRTYRRHHQSNEYYCSRCDAIVSFTYAQVGELDAAAAP